MYLIGIVADQVDAAASFVHQVFFFQRIRNNLRVKACAFIRYADGKNVVFQDRNYSDLLFLLKIISMHNGIVDGFAEAKHHVAALFVAACNMMLYTTHNGWVHLTLIYKRFQTTFLNLHCSNDYTLYT